MNFRDLLERDEKEFKAKIEKTIADIKDKEGTIFYPIKYSGEDAYWKIIKATKTGAEVLFLKTNKPGTFTDDEKIKLKG